MNLLSGEEGDCAVSAAVSFVSAAVLGTPVPQPVFPESFSELRGVFVTLTENGELRGCIGYPYPALPLKEALLDAAYQAALCDPRFYPVGVRELPSLDIEVTVLSPPEKLTVPAAERASAVTVGKHGLIAERGRFRGLLLPQVPLEWGWDSAEFLDQTCIKAGLPPHAWKEETCTILTFEGQIFKREHPWQ